MKKIGDCFEKLLTDPKNSLNCIWKILKAYVERGKMWSFFFVSSAWKWQQTIPVLHIIIVINKHCIAQVTLWSHKNALGTIHPLLYIYKYERQPEKAKKPDRLLAPNRFSGSFCIYTPPSLTPSPPEAHFLTARLALLFTFDCTALHLA